MSVFNWSLTQVANTHKGERIIFSINGVVKTEYTHIEESHYIQKSTQNRL